MWSLIWGGVGDYTDSYKALVYAYTPMALFVWVLPLSVIWSFILLGIATAKLHALSTARAVWMIILLFVMLTALGVAGAYFAGLPAKFF